MLKIKVGQTFVSLSGATAITSASRSMQLAIRHVRTTRMRSMSIRKGSFTMLFSAWRRPSRRAPARGFTLVELLVVIAIIGILVALLLPAIQAAREAARRVSCANNLHNIAVAVLNYDNSKKGLPPAASSKPTAGEVWGSVAELETDVSWIVHILPYMEDQDVADQFDVKKPLSLVNPATATARPWEIQPEILLCPSDNARGRTYTPAPTGRGGGAGFQAGFSFGKGNYAAYVSPIHIICMRTFPGALINEIQPLSRISDGTSKTLMLAEIRTRDHASDPRGTWAAAITNGTLLAFDMHDRTAGTGCGTQRNSPYIPQENPAIDALTPNSMPTGNSDRVRECPEGNVAALELMPCDGYNGTWTAGAPRSRHQGGVNAANIDGSVVFLSDDINKFVMAYMVSINDGYGNLENAPPVSRRQP
jgi:prepilin-type N-terminal cleavage/methylation domain-containing protein